VVDKEQKRKTPTGIKLLAVLQIIGGLFLIGLPCFVAFLYSEINIAIVLIAGLGVGTIFLAKALLALKKWAWYTNIGLCVIGVPLWYVYSVWDLLWYVYSVGIDELIIAGLCVGSIIPLTVGLAWLGCLFRVKHVFLKTQKGEGAREEKEVKT